MFRVPLFNPRMVEKKVAIRHAEPRSFRLQKVKFFEFADVFTRGARGDAKFSRERALLGEAFSVLARVLGEAAVAKFCALADLCAAEQPIRDQGREKLFPRYDSFPLYAGSASLVVWERRILGPGKNLAIVAWVWHWKMMYWLCPVITNGEISGSKSLAAHCVLRSTAPDFLLVQPFINGRTGEAGEFSCQFQVRETAHEEIVDCTRAHAQAGGKLALGLEFGQLVEIRAGGVLNCFKLVHCDSFLQLQRIRALLA